MEFNEFIGEETLDREYKSFPIDVPYSDYETISFIKNPFSSFNSIILENIEKIINNFLPKYLCSFMDTLSKSDDGTLYIGIDDDGFVSGIPYLGFLSWKIIDYFLNKTINEKIVSNKQLFIQFELIEVEYKETENKIDSYIDEYLNEKNRISNENKYINEKYNTWNDIYKQYNKNLIELYKTKKEEFIEYVDDKSITNNFPNELSKLTHEEIAILKMDTTNIYHWICKWKELKLNYLKKQRPNDLPKKCNVLYTPYYILRDMKNIIPYWKNMNENLNIYVIKINLKRDIGNDIYYVENKHLKKSYRTLDSFGNPCCLEHEPFFHNISSTEFDIDIDEFVDNLDFTNI